MTCLLCLVLDRPMSADEAQISPTVVQFPLVVSPIVIAYRWDSINTNAPPIVFDILTLARYDTYHVEHSHYIRQAISTSIFIDHRPSTVYTMNVM